MPKPECSQARDHQLVDLYGLVGSDEGLNRFQDDFGHTDESMELVNNLYWEMLQTEGKESHVGCSRYFSVQGVNNWQKTGDAA